MTPRQLLLFSILSVFLAGGTFTCKASSGDEDDDVQWTVTRK